MFEVIFRTAWRQARADGLYSALNVIGLAVGLACCLVVWIYIDSERGWDRSWPDADRLVRVSAAQSDDSHGGDRRFAAVSNLAFELLESVPSVEVAARLFPRNGTARVTVGDQQTNELGVANADPTLFDLFPPTVIAGDPKLALSAPGRVVLTRSTAEHLFGDDDALGRTIEVYRSGELTVGAVIEDLAETSHLPTRIFISMLDIPDDFFVMRTWELHLMHTYARVTAGTDLDRLEADLAGALDRGAPKEIATNLSLVVFPVTDIHLHSDFEREMVRHGVADQVQLFALVALAVILVACANFANLATARAARRARSIGLKRAFGVSRARVAFELVAESVAASALSVMLALALVPWLLPRASALAGRSLAVEPGSWGSLLLALVVLTIGVGVAAGAYPAFVLSGFRPAETLRGRLSSGRSGRTMRDALVVGQFAVAIFLVVVTLSTARQLDWASRFDLGFERDDVVLLHNVDDAEIDVDLLASELERNPYVHSVTATSRALGTGWPSPVTVVSEALGVDGVEMAWLGVAPGFFEAFGVEMMEGRELSEQLATDVMVRPSEEGIGRGPVVISRAGVRALGLEPSEAIGQRLELTRHQGRFVVDVVGVIDDLYLGSTLEPLQPLMAHLDPNNYNVVAIEIAPDNRLATSAFIDRTWDAVSPEMPIIRTMMADDLEDLYRGERRRNELFRRFSALALFVAGLGLVGLASYETEQRVLEIGVRKVFGASVWDITRLFNLSIARLVLFGALVATPAVVWFVGRWLQRFAYARPLGVAEIVIGVIAVLAVALLSVSGRVVPAALGRPALALRRE